MATVRLQGRGRRRTVVKRLFMRYVAFPSCIFMALYAFGGIRRIRRAAASISSYLSKPQSMPPLVYQPPSLPGVERRPCRYEGNCGVGTTCAVDESSSMGGSCQPYKSTTSSVNKYLCSRKCLAGLGPDVVIEQISTSEGVGRPNTCMLRYGREKGLKPRRFNRDEYVNATKQHRIFRVDPYGAQKWTALCYEPCDTTCTKGFVCKENVCQRDESYWEPSTKDHEMVFVTGANSAYFRALMNLAGSIRYWAPKHKLVVYNLGLSQENLKILETWGNVLDVKWKKGIPDNYPSHLRNLKVYAWKPVAINESLHEYKQIFWLDAGSTVTGPITEAIRITQNTGIFLVNGQDADMKPYSHPGTYRAFGYDKATFRAGPHYSGNTQAYLYPSRYVDTVVIPNAQCALQQDCIMPRGSSLRNHRYDQTTLSILSYRDDLRIPGNTMYLAAGREQLVSDLKQPSTAIVWTSRASCEDFMDQMEGYDKLDQMEHDDMLDD